MLVREPELMASQILQDKVLSHDKIKVLFNTDVQEFNGSGGKLESVSIKNSITGEEEQITPAGVFVFIGQIPNTSFLEDSGIELDDWKFIVTGHDLVHDRHVGLNPEDCGLQINSALLGAVGAVEICRQFVSHCSSPPLELPELLPWAREPHHAP